MKLRWPFAFHRYCVLPISFQTYTSNEIHEAGITNECPRICSCGWDDNLRFIATSTKR